MEYQKIKNVIGMLESPDPENHVVALTIMEQQEYKEVLTPLLLAYKFGRPKEKIWNEHAPNAMHFIKGNVVIVQGKGLTYNDIFKCIAKKQVPAKQMELFMTLFAEYLTKQCKNLGYSFIDKIEFTVKTEEDDKGER